MIYRIAIYRYENGQRKFDHYATSDEMRYLRVNADGKVEMADVDPYTAHVFYGWLDVSSTHEVEWGCIHEGIKLYENDVVTAKYYLFQDEGKYNYHGLIYYDKESYSIGLGYVCVNPDKKGISDGIGNLLCEYNHLILLGNIRQHPELISELGGKDE